LAIRACIHGQPWRSEGTHGALSGTALLQIGRGMEEHKEYNALARHIAAQSHELWRRQYRAAQVADGESGRDVPFGQLPEEEQAVELVEAAKVVAAVRDTATALWDRGREPSYLRIESRVRAQLDTQGVAVPPRPLFRSVVEAVWELVLLEWSSNPNHPRWARR
jgi:hypothetical protein